MYQTYETKCSNEIHQLMVSVSRHFYITPTGNLKHQKKPFEVSLGKPKKFPKRHIVHYLVRDHFSGLFYVEITDIENMFSVFDFLYRAWSKKDNHPLYGVPYGVTVPKGVRTVWPQLVPFLEEAAIQPIEVTSGFQGGIRDIRTWEEWLRGSLSYDLYTSGYPPNYKKVLQLTLDRCADFNTSKTELWAQNLPEDVFLPTSKYVFTPSQLDGNSG